MYKMIKGIRLIASFFICICLVVPSLPMYALANEKTVKK